MDKYIGKRLDGRYEIKELIGVGGMAYVYKAYDRIDDRTVAIKILKDEYMQNEDFTRRFKNESKAIAILSHPNIVKVNDVSFGTNLQYIVMEYIDGITLKEYMDQQKALKWKEAVHFTTQILLALQHAHDKGIVHRDIKPQNIMLLSDGTIKVTDFGIARFCRRETRATTDSQKAIGSVHYISPEQAKGDVTDEKSDIYSVGVMLYEMLTGTLPFEADNAVSVAIMQLQAEARHPREINPDIPEGLEDITLKAMQKDPAMRYQSAAEMLRDIEEFKLNPSIHFAYKYFVDDTPTKFVDAIAQVKDNPTHTAELEEEAGNEDEPEKKSPVMAILVAVAAAFVLVAVVVVAIVLGTKLFGSSNTNNVTVPSFLGQTQEQIMNTVDYTKNFVFDFSQVEYNSAAAGTVIAQNVKANTVVKAKKSTIKLTISLGPKTNQIPDVINETQAEALGEMESAGFTDVKVITQTSDKVEKGRVMDVYPKAYPEHVAMDYSLTLIVSSGEKAAAPVALTNVVGTTKESASATLTNQGFLVEIVMVNDVGKTSGTVLSQTPAAGTTATPGSTVTLKVASGYKSVSLSVPMPNYNGMVDMVVLMDGQVNTAYSKGLTGIMASSVSSKTITFNETEKSTYTVTIQISQYNENNYVPYAQYVVNAATGEITNTLLNRNIYQDLTTTTSTTATTDVAATTSSTSSTTETTTTTFVY